MADFEIAESQGGELPSEKEVSILPLNTAIGPEEVLVLTTADILLVDFTDVASAAQGMCVIQNLGPNSIYLAFHNSATGGGPGVVVGDGLELVAGAEKYFDMLGGLAIWAIGVTANQIALAGTRVMGGKRV